QVHRRRSVARAPWDLPIAPLGKTAQTGAGLRRTGPRGSPSLQVLSALPDPSVLSPDKTNGYNSGDLNEPDPSSPSCAHRIADPSTRTQTRAGPGQGVAAARDSVTRKCSAAAAAAGGAAKPAHSRALPRNSRRPLSSPGGAPEPPPTWPRRAREVAVLVQRVVKDITNAFRRNPHIDEIGLIPCPEARYNRSPIVLVENKLGVESWCVKFLLPYVHNKLLLYRTRKQWLNKDELLDVTCTLLLLNPDFTTAWNVRRWVLQQVIQETSLPSFVTKGILETTPAERTQRLIQEEMEVCGEAAGRYPSNYNAWSHRIWVLQNLAKLDVKILLDELSSTKHWASMHVSDHSGFHYRQFLLKSLISQTVNDSSALEQNPLRNESAPVLPKDEAAAASTEEPRINLPHLLEEEVEFSTDLIDSYPGHETLWCHRRHVFYLQHHLSGRLAHNLIQLPSADSPGGTVSDLHIIPAGPQLSQAMEVDGLNDSSKQGYSQETKRLKRTPASDSLGLEMEHRFIDQVLSTCRNVEQARYANAYRKWLVTLSQ
uniref:Protein prenyltransferase alpha subunit repeat containing 1 n=1 Tax=Oryctolagus cuniculus TaxID=9986 RepID=A0A5F9CER3_RABIT